MKCWDIGDRRRILASEDVAPTLISKMGTGGNNVPILIEQRNEMTNGRTDRNRLLQPERDWNGQQDIDGDGECRPDTRRDGGVNHMDEKETKCFENHAQDANNGGGQSRECILCVHGSQDPITNPAEYANPIGTNQGQETCVCNAIKIKASSKASSVAYGDVSPCLDTEGGNNIGIAGDQHEEPIFDCAVCGHFGEAWEWNASEFIDRTSMEISTPFPLEELEAFKAVMYGCPKCDAWYPSKKMWNDKQVTHTVEQRVMAAIDGDKINKQERKGVSGLGIHTEDVGYTNTAKDVHGVATKQTAGMLAQLTVRRLLPVETERLMGFPDGHTQIPWKGKPAEECPDSPRYNACGNSMCVNCMEWIGKRIQMEEERIQAEARNEE